MEILGYIYIIQSLCYEKRLKIGSTKNINRRKWDYHTYVPDEVYYNSYFCIIDYGKFQDRKDPLKAIETTIHKHSWFKEKRSNQKKEFFIHDNSVEDFVRNIEYLLDVYGAIFKPIYKDEIYNRPVKEKFEYIKEDIINNEIDINFRLRDYQEECINIMNREKIGKFILPTGSGKTVIFLSYLREIGGINLVLVPFIELVNQTYEKAKMFKFDKIIKICQGEKICWGKGKNVLYISTYQSSDKEIYSLCDIEFDNIIYDETHYTVLSGENENSTFQYILENGIGKKKFFFTATEKNIKVKVRKNMDIENVEENDRGQEEEIGNKEISMDNKDIYGEVLYNMTIDQAIEKNIICDYNINIWLHRENNKEETIKKIIEKKVGNKILIFCSSINKVRHLTEYLDNNFCKEKYKNFYINYADGKMGDSQRKQILKDFKETKETSILVLCGLFKVGFDCPCIDTVIHYDKCVSTIDLIQKNGRCLRKFSGKIKSTIILLTNTDNHDTDIIHYKKMLNSMNFYDKRIKGKLTELKEKKSQGIYSTIDIIYDIENNVEKEMYGIYDKYMNYISGYNNVIRKMEILVEYRLKHNKWPKRSAIYKNIYIGHFWSGFKQYFLKPIKMNKKPLCYIKEKEQFIKILKNNNLYEKVLESVKLKEKIIEKTPMEKMEKIVEYRLKNNKWPIQSAIYENINIGNFWSNFKQYFLKQIKMNKEPLRYITEKEQLIKILKNNNLYKEALIKLKEKLIEKTPIEKMEILVEYRLKYNKWPVRSTIYDNINIGRFWDNFKYRFLKQIKMNKEPLYYVKEKEHIIKILKNNNLYGEVLESVMTQ